MRGHAFLAVGPTEGALLGHELKFLQAAFCEKGGCGDCPACRKLREGSHVDVLILEGNVKVDDVRGVAPFIARKPFDSPYRAVAIRGAHRMTAQAANALLKPLEEPPPHTLFVLTTTALGAILPTVRSRCEIVRLRPPSREEGMAVLMSAGVDEKRARLLLNLSGGFPDEGLRLNADETFWERRAGAFDACSRLASARNYAYSSSLDFITAGDVDGALSMMAGWFCDLALIKTGGPIKNIDEAERLSALKDAFTLDKLGVIIDCVSEARFAVKGNANARLACEGMLIRILEEKHR